MISLEKVELLCERTGLTYEEAKIALEITDGDILQAIINLENQGRIEAPNNEGFYSTKKDVEDEEKFESNKENQEDNGVGFKELLIRFWEFLKRLTKKGNRNSFEIRKNNEYVMSIPVTIVVILLITTFYITVPVMVIGLFLGFSYRFQGPDLGKDNVNNTMDSVSKAASNLKKEFTGDRENEEDSNN